MTSYPSRVAARALSALAVEQEMPITKTNDHPFDERSAEDKEQIDVSGDDARTLPQELLCEICTAAALSALTMDSLDAMHPAWTLSQVSSRWRSAARLSVVLWVHVVLPFDAYTNSNPATIVDSLTTFLARSEDYTISVTITGKDKSLRKHNDALIHLRNLSSDRWRHADIAIPLIHYKSLIPGGCCLVNLEYLAVTFGDYFDSDQGYPTESDYPDAPVLNAITTDQPAAILHLFLGGKLHKYTHLQNQHNLETHLLNLVMLKRGYFASLEYLNLHVGNTSPNFEPVELPCLITLIIHGDANAIRGFTRILHVPSLKVLSLESNSHIEEVVDLDAPLNEPCLFASHSPEIVGVVLDMQMVYGEIGEALRRFCAEIPRLRCLELRLKGDVGDTTTLCEVLRVTQDSYVAPELKAVLLWTRSASIVLDDDIAESISRSRGGDFRFTHISVTTKEEAKAEKETETE